MKWSGQNEMDIFSIINSNITLSPNLPICFQQVAIPFKSTLSQFRFWSDPKSKLDMKLFQTQFRFWQPLSDPISFLATPFKYTLSISIFAAEEHTAEK